jgi:hypothetical protein
LEIWVKSIQQCTMRNSQVSIVGWFLLEYHGTSKCYDLIVLVGILNSPKYDLIK